MKLKHHSFTTLKQGKVYAINLKENNLPSKRADIKALLMGKNVVIEDVTGVVIGIEMYAAHEDYDHKEVGIMIK